MPAKLKITNLDNLIKQYLGGKSLKQISVQTGIARTCLTPRFEAEGVQLRSRSEAERLKWSKMDRAAVVRQCRAAWKAALGRTLSDSELVTRAIRIQGYGGGVVGRFELALLKRLKKEGIAVTHQFPFGPYNIDIFMHSPGIAVEVWGTYCMSNRREELRKRTECILNAGYILVNVYIPAKTGQRIRPGLSAIAQQLVTLHKRARRDKSLRGKHWMIGRNGEPVTSKRFDLDGLPCID